MTVKAIDIALILPDSFVEECTKINSSFENPRYRFNSKDCFPHITLVMSGIKDIESLEKEISEALCEFNSFEITIDSLTCSQRGDLPHFSYFTIKETESLSLLRKKVFDIAKKYACLVEDKSSFYDSEDFDENTTLSWVNNHISRREKDFSQFNSHISLGFGKVESKEVNKVVNIKEVGIFQLGNYCSCRKLIKKIEL